MFKQSIVLGQRLGAAHSGALRVQLALRHVSAEKSSTRHDQSTNDLLACSRGVDGCSYLSRDTVPWLGPLAAQLPRQFWVHDDLAARQAARRIGAAAFVRGDRIFLGEVAAAWRESVVRHELVHLAQVQIALRTGRVASPASIEHEADTISGLPVARPAQQGAHPHQLHRFVWFVAIGAGLYILLRPGVANAPGPGDRVLRSPSMAQIAGEAFCIFAVPGGAIALGGRIGLGFLGSAALAGASSNVGLRVVGDVAHGKASSPLMYLTDAGTGAVIGFVVPGGFRLIGRAGTQGFDGLATYGMSRSDIALTRVLSEQASRTPLTATAAREILASRGMVGQVSQWWLNRRGVMVLYRGQGAATSQILSPLARQEGVAASEALVARLRSLHITDTEIATWTARYHNAPVPSVAAPPGLGGLGLGGAGIPTTTIPGIAANFGAEGTIYVIRVPRSLAVRPNPWQGLAVEDEFVVFNQIPGNSIVEAIPARRVLPLIVDEFGRLTPSR